MTDRIIKICSIDGCNNTVMARGWCSKHYERWRQHGDPNALTRPYFRDPEESFIARTRWQGDCLIWTASANEHGYGQIWVNGDFIKAHRYAWERTNGVIPDGMSIDHICHRSACVNVKHLRLATIMQNGAHRNGASTSNKSSGIRNVYLHHGNWTVKLVKNGKAHRFGTFDTISEAVSVAEQARKDLFGEYAGRG